MYTVGSSSNVNSFSIIQTPAGTSPVADSSDDTLTLTSSDSSLTITGNSTTDTVDFIVNMASVGDVDGPASSTDSAVALFNGTTGKIIKNSSIIVSSGAISGVDSITTTTSNGSLTLTANGSGTITAGSNLVMGTNSIKLGTTNNASISHDGSNLIVLPNSIVNPTLIIGSSSAAITGHIRLNKMAVNGGTISSVAMISIGGAISTERQGIAGTLSYGGSGANGSYIASSYNDSGTATTFTCNGHYSTVALVSGSSHTSNYTQNALRGEGGVDAALNISTGTYNIAALRVNPTASGVGGTHSGGTVRTYGILQETITAFTGVSTNVIMGAFFNDDVCIKSDTKLILESSQTTKGDSYLVFNSASTDMDVFIDNTQVWNWDNDLNRSEVPLGTKAGTSTTYAKVGGVIDVNTTSTGNVGTGEDDLITFSVPANTLATNGDRIQFQMAGTFAANANNKTIKIKYGGTTLLDTTALAINGGSWSAEGVVVRTGAATQKAFCAFRTNNVLLTSTSNYTTPAETLSGAVTLKATGEATSNNDITQEINIVEFYPNE